MLPQPLDVLYSCLGEGTILISKLASEQLKNFYCLLNLIQSLNLLAITRTIWPDLNLLQGRDQ